MWSFERFFTEVTRILSKKKIHIFFVNRLSEHRVYLDKSENLENFQGWDLYSSFVSFCWNSSNKLNSKTLHK